MEEIELSFLPRSQKTLSLLQAQVEEFEKQTRVHVNLRQVAWSRLDLNRFAIDQSGPDVSEVGTTWIDDYIAMNSLRAFKVSELAQIGKPEDFLPSSWQAGQLSGNLQVWAIPWLAEPFVIHYRNDLLRQAGIDPIKAFQTHAQLAQAIDLLKQNGVRMPFGAPVRSTNPTTNPFCIIHALCSWVWSRGTDFCSPDGKQVWFNQPEALAAMRDYFQLFRSIPSEDVSELVKLGNIEAFRQGRAAITFGTMTVLSPWEEVAPLVRENWSVAAFPQTGFVGGTSLVIWNYTRNERASMDLVRFLTQNASLLSLSRQLYTLPPRLSALAEPALQNDPLWSKAIQAAMNGRSSPSVKLWGMIEERLLNVLHQIADAIIADPDLDLDVAIRKPVDQLARVLNITLAQ